MVVAVRQVVAGENRAGGHPLFGLVASGEPPGVDLPDGVALHLAENHLQPGVPNDTEVAASERVLPASAGKVLHIDSLYYIVSLSG